MKQKNPIFDKRHVREYLMYGAIAALLFTIPVWYYLRQASYENGWLVFLGCALFMFVIMFYTVKLTRRRTDYKSAVTMLIAGHLCVVAGTIIAILLSLSVAAVYLPGFLNSGSQQHFLEGAPPNSGSSFKSVIFQVLVAATLGNLAAGSFIVVVISYALKFNQTKDSRASLYKYK
jgi:hypothetical protein